MGGGLTLRHGPQVLDLESGHPAGVPALLLPTISKMLLFFLLLQSPFPKCINMWPQILQ